jgi:hypothetical protein
MCHTVPIAASAVTTMVWAKTKSPKIAQLNLMLYGASVFGIVDHWWHGELFLFSGNAAKDLCVGFMVTGCVFAVWAMNLARDKALEVAAPKK